MNKMYLCVDKKTLGKKCHSSLTMVLYIQYLHNLRAVKLAACGLDPEEFMYSPLALGASLVSSLARLWRREALAALAAAEKTGQGALTAHKQWWGVVLFSCMAVAEGGGVDFCCSCGQGRGIQYSYKGAHSALAVKGWGLVLPMHACSLCGVWPRACNWCVMLPPAALKMDSPDIRQ